VSDRIQVLIACLAILSVVCVAGLIWLAGVVAILKERVDVLDDIATPSFEEEHQAPKPVWPTGPLQPDPDEIREREPKTRPDQKQASKVAPPQSVREFTGARGKHTFTFRGDQ
jgi:hypothetical protein